jgi:hypothetical protein
VSPLCLSPQIRQYLLREKKELTTRKKELTWFNELLFNQYGKSGRDQPFLISPLSIITII